MPNRAEEIAHLAEADRHIAQARERIGRLEKLLSERSNPAVPAHAEAQRSLTVMQETLHAMLQHRAEIAGMIAAIDAGRLPSGTTRTTRFSHGNP